MMMSSISLVRLTVGTIVIPYKSNSFAAKNTRGIKNMYQKSFHS